MPDVPKHAWTHRPKALGGTDPITIEAGAMPESAIARSPGLYSTSLTSSDPINFSSLWATPGSAYTPDTADPTDFEYIMLNQDGFYQADFMIYWSTDFGASTFPFIQPSAMVNGTPDALNASVEAAWDNTQSWIGGEQFDAAEMDHHSLVSTVWFTYTAAGVHPSFGIGVDIRSSFVGTKSVGGMVAVTRLGVALEEQV